MDKIIEKILSADVATLTFGSIFLVLLILAVVAFKLDWKEIFKYVLSRKQNNPVELLLNVELSHYQEEEIRTITFNPTLKLSKQEDLFNFLLLKVKELDKIKVSTKRIVLNLSKVTKINSQAVSHISALIDTVLDDGNVEIKVIVPKDDLFESLKVQWEALMSAYHIKNNEKHNFAQIKFDDKKI